MKQVWLLWNPTHPKGMLSCTAYLGVNSKAPCSAALQLMGSLSETVQPLLAYMNGYIYSLLTEAFEHVPRSSAVVTGLFSKSLCCLGTPYCNVH